MEPASPDQPDPRVFGHFGESTTLPCEACGSTPTGGFTFKANTGFLLFRQIWAFHGRLCAACAQGTYRDYQARNIARGPWGIISIFAAVWFLIANAWSYRSTNLSRPHPYDPAADRVRRGRPVFARVGPWVSIAVLTLLLGLTSGLMSFVDNSGLLTDPDTAWSVGACVHFDGDKANLTDCSAGPDALIVSIVSDPTSCPGVTRWHVEVTDNRFACLQEA